MLGWNKWQAAAFKVPAFGSDSFHTSPTFCTDIVDPLILSRNPCSTTGVQPTFKMNLRSRKLKETPPPVHLSVEQRLANDEAQAEAILCGSPDNGEGLVGNASSFEGSHGAGPSTAAAPPQQDVMVTKKVTVWAECPCGCGVCVRTGKHGGPGRTKCPHLSLIHI